MSLPSSRLPITLQTQLDDRGFGLAALPDHAAVSLVVVDKDCLIQRANTAIYALAGRDPSGPAQGLRLGELLEGSVATDYGKCGTNPEGRACAVRAAIENTIQTDTDHSRVPGSMFFTRNSVTEECHLLLSSTRFETGGSGRVLVCLEDVTDIRKADLIPPDQMPVAEQALVEALATGEPSLGQIDVLRDISERKQIEARSGS
jgi:hypothetical protein